MHKIENKIENTKKTVKLKKCTELKSWNKKLKKSGQNDEFEQMTDDETRQKMQNL